MSPTPANGADSFEIRGRPSRSAAGHLNVHRLDALSGRFDVETLRLTA